MTEYPVQGNYRTAFPEKGGRISERYDHDLTTSDLLKKFEYTYVPSEVDIGDDIDDYQKEALKVFSNQKPQFEYEVRGSTRGISENKLNLRERGVSFAKDPDMPEHFFGDTTGSSVTRAPGPDYNMFRRISENHMKHRESQFGPDACNTVTGGGWNPVALYRTLRTTVRKRAQNMRAIYYKSEETDPRGAMPHNWNSNSIYSSVNVGDTQFNRIIQNQNELSKQGANFRITEDPKRLFKVLNQETYERLKTLETVPQMRQYLRTNNPDLLPLFDSLWKECEEQSTKKGKTLSDPKSVIDFIKNDTQYKDSSSCITKKAQLKKILNTILQEQIKQDQLLQDGDTQTCKTSKQARDLTALLYLIMQSQDLHSSKEQFNMKGAKYDKTMNLVNATKSDQLLKEQMRLLNKAGIKLSSDLNKTSRLAKVGALRDSNAILAKKRAAMKDPNSTLSLINNGQLFVDSKSELTKLAGKITENNLINQVKNTESYGGNLAGFQLKGRMGDKKKVRNHLNQDIHNEFEHIDGMRY